MEDNNSNADKNSCILDATSESSYILTDFMEKVTHMQIVPMSEGMEIGRGGGDEMNAINVSAIFLMTMKLMIPILKVTEVTRVKTMLTRWRLKGIRGSGSG